MISALLGIALAGPQATDALIYTVVDAIYGKPISREAVCIERPLFPASLDLDAVAVGVRRGALGCKLLGVMVDGSFHQELDKATASAFPDAVWGAADGPTRAAWLKDWTVRVVLAFEDVDADKATVKGANPWVVETNGARRTTETYVSERVVQHHTWSSARTLADKSATSKGRYRLSFNARETSVDGVDAARVHAGLETVGKRFGRCVEAAWSEHLTLEGRIRLQWSVAGGKAHKIAVIAQDDDGSGLAQCYAHAVETVDFAPELAGKVVWAFNLVQTAVEP